MTKHASHHDATGLHEQGLRVEDDKLTRGVGLFVDDAAASGQAYVAFVRAQHAHAGLRAIDTVEARAMPGVLRILTAADMEAAKITNVTRHPPMQGRDGRALVIPKRPALAADRVLHVGQTIAAVVAETAHQARAAAEAIVVDYEERPALVQASAALEDGAVELWPQAPGNIALDWPGPVEDDGENAQTVARIIASAAKVARVRVVQQRICAATLEPRGALAHYDAQADTYTLRCGCQGANAIRDLLASIMGHDRDKIRVVSDEVGGAFGMKSPVYPEYPVLLLAARLTGRSVRWTEDRSEAFLADHQSRDTTTEGELAMDAEGRFLALRIRHLANLGGYCAPTGANLQTNNFARCFPAMYDIAHVDIAVRCVFTNTIPTSPFRGAGRPEANYVMERLVDEAARVIGADRAALRRRNLVPAAAMPYTSAIGNVYDSGDFVTVFDKAMALAHYGDFETRRRASAARGRYRGFGISCFLEHSGGSPTEGAALLFGDDDTVVVQLGVQSTGQGHATMYPRLVAAQLGIPSQAVRHRHGDSAFDIKGATSVASRSTMTAGTAVVRTVEAVIEKGRRIAALLLEAAEADIAYGDGAFTVAGTDRTVSLFTVARRAREFAAQGKIAETLDTKLSVDTPQTYPNGCHIAEVEIDPDTGATQVLRYTAVDDCGTVMDHVLVQGQIHGGMAIGLGQALMENAYYDSASGQLLSASFTDYALPRADDVPNVVDESHPVPATTNPLGVKGAGEAGTTAALAAIMNAIADAIPGGAGAAIDMPATPEKVWRACQSAKALSRATP